MPAIQVVNFNDILEGFSKDTFEASLCVRFRYIVQRSYLDINRNDAYSLYEAVSKFNKTNHCKYTLLEKKAYFVRIDTSLYDGTYCQMEWFAPVAEKN
jgi:AraC family transcriptional regulator